ncbi:MAG TPA: hypothetical protein VL172_17985, partial [Kofleriaceae bacterium]|nr:hypothetical protein [Kofleriaceae bacterium]
GVGVDMSGVWVAGSSDVFAGVASGDVLRWNGSAWTSTGQANLVGINALWGADTDHVFAVGSGGGISALGPALYWHQGGWTLQDTTATGRLYSVWGAAAGDVFAVGLNGTIRHWNGAGWEGQDADSGTGEILTGVWGAGADVYAVGYNGTIRHRSGGVWTSMPSLPDALATLIGVWVSGPDDVFVLSPVAVFHWNGAAWSQTPLAGGRALWGDGPADVFVVGNQSWHYDGLSWSPQASLPRRFDAVSGIAGGDLFAVGESGAVARLARACAAQELACADGADDDCDGTYDCGDVDCDGDPACAGGGLCDGAEPLVCSAGTTLVAAGSTAAGANRIDRYACDDWYELGKEAVYRLTGAAAGTVTVTASDLTRDLDLIVLSEGAGGGCEPRNPGCRAAASTDNAAGSETVSFTAQAGKTYYLVIDGYGAAAGDFSLAVDCP